MEPIQREEVDHSSSASAAFVCVSGFLCLLLVIAYCHCYCNEARAAHWRLFRRQKATMPLQLPVVSYRKSQELSRGCVVCLNDFEDKEEVKVIPACGHVFHPQCIDRWVVTQRSCPVCRCSKMLDKENESPDKEEAVATQQQVEVLEVRLERSSSWCYRGVDLNGSGVRIGMRRTCSF